MQSAEAEEDAKEEDEPKQQKSKSLRSKAFHLVSDFASFIFSPASDKPSKELNSEDDLNESVGSESEEGDSDDPPDGPDTSSFSAFLYSLLGSSDSQRSSTVDGETASSETVSESISMKEEIRRKTILSRGRRVLGKALHQAARMGGFRQAPKSNPSPGSPDADETSEQDGIAMETLNVYETVVPPDNNLPETSEPSQLISEKTRSFLYSSLPVIVQGRKWLLLYSTWRHGISLSTLYRRSMLWPGLSLLVVGDRKGAVFGGLVEAPMIPTNKKKYQGTNTSFVFSDICGQPVIYRPTGVNRYFTLCSMEYLAMGGGSHFALYLDSELLIGSSSSSETYGNPCLATSQDFEVKEVELWGFVYASKYDEMVALSRLEAPGICRW